MGWGGEACAAPVVERCAYVGPVDRVDGCTTWRAEGVGRKAPEGICDARPGAAWVVLLFVYIPRLSDVHRELQTQ